MGQRQKVWILLFNGRDLCEVEREEKVIGYVFIGGLGARRRDIGIIIIIIMVGGAAEWIKDNPGQLTGAMSEPCV